MIYRLAFLILFSVLLSLTGCRRDRDVHRTPEGELVLGAEQAAEIIERSVSLEGRTLVLEGYSGSVSVRGTDETTARLRFEKIVRERDERRALEELGRVSIEEAGDANAYRFRISSRRPERSDVNVTAEVPRNTPITLTLDNGEVTIEHVRGTIQLEVTNGNVAIRGAARDVNATVRNGNIDLGFAAVPEDTRIEGRSTNGNLTLRLPEDASLRVEAETQAGTIRVEGLTFTNQRLRETVTGATFTGTLGTGNARAGLRADNGNIAFQAAAPSPAAAPAAE